mmetsp:Transcript_41466/g.109359  ORF Transcript_41466/g.109359 Transcript_41466/m.109359 type:complete len:203 (-) Transcript_41466:707-1315(-)
MALPWPWLGIRNVHLGGDHLPRNIVPALARVHGRAAGASARDDVRKRHFRFCKRAWTGQGRRAQCVRRAVFTLLAHILAACLPLHGLLLLRLRHETAPEPHLPGHIWRHLPGVCVLGRSGSCHLRRGAQRAAAANAAASAHARLRGPDGLQCHSLRLLPSHCSAPPGLVALACKDPDRGKLCGREHIAEPTRPRTLWRRWPG